MTDGDKPTRWNPPAGTLTTLGPKPGKSDEEADLGAAMTEQVGVPDARELDAISVLQQGETFRNGAIVGDRYVVERHISSGSFGAVYKARDASIEDHAVALKVLLGASITEAARKKALRELQLIASVTHPSVVQFKDYGWIGDNLWFTMPWYDGKTLFERLGGEQEPAEPLGRQEAKLLFERLAHGLAAMHEVGVFHHDIKPENIFIAEVSGFDGGLPVLLDLGIASKEGEKPVGFTAKYVSPETASAAMGLSSQEIGAAADVYSLALSLRNAMEPATAPRSDGNHFAFLERRASEPVSPPQGGDLRYLAPSFRRWLSIKPTDRPSAKGFADELKVLTAPEERRRARLQLVKRLIPVVLLAGILVAVLAFQLTRTEELLSEKEERLEETSEELSIKALEASQLAHKTEQQQELIESEAAKAKKSERILKKLDKKLEKTSRDHGELETALNELQIIHLNLSKKHDVQSAEIETLRGEHSQLNKAHGELIATSKTMQEDNDALRAANKSLESDLAAGTKELNNLKATISKFDRKVANLEKRVAELKERLTRLRAKNQRTSPKNTQKPEETTIPEPPPETKEPKTPDPPSTNP